MICGLSGGVDSAVAAVLISRRDRRAADLRLRRPWLDADGRAEHFVSLFRNSYNIPLVHVEAEGLFLDGLAGLTDPEAKRKFIGKTFIDVFDEEAGKFGGADFLAQGTLYPDVIESASFTGGPSVTIKSHHNVGGLPERMNMKLVEPLRELFKDEVRELGRELGLPDAFVGGTRSRAGAGHPHPGRGHPEQLRILRRPTPSTSRRSATLGSTTALAGVRGAAAGPHCRRDGGRRTYDSVCGLRAVTTTTA